MGLADGAAWDAEYGWLQDVKVRPDPEPDDCDFYYFKPGGKWKYDGAGRFPRPTHSGWHDVNRDEIIRENGGMPGITSRGNDYVVIIIPRENCDVRTAYPRMLRPEVE